MMKKKVKNLITTRILRLRGLQSGVNKGVESIVLIVTFIFTEQIMRIGLEKHQVLDACNFQTDVLDLYSKVIEGIHLWIEEI